MIIDLLLTNSFDDVVKYMAMKKNFTSFCTNGFIIATIIIMTLPLNYSTSAKVELETSGIFVTLAN